MPISVHNSYKTIYCWRQPKVLNLLSTRQQKQTRESIDTAIKKTRECFPNMGARTMVAYLKQKDTYGIRVPE